MVKDTFPTKEGAEKWANHSRKKGYNVRGPQGHRGSWTVERTRKKRR